MTYLNKWFDYNQRQIEMKASIEEAILRVPESNLSLNEFYLLHYLNEAPDKQLRQYELPHKLNLSASAISRMITRLEAKGCQVITKNICSDDKRATSIQLTTYGKELLNDVHQEVEKELEEYKQFLDIGEEASV